jgi:nucleoside-diphosphate-sugar epimerase
MPELNNIYQTILVTGGAGYIGSILLRRLLQNNFKVICLDCLRYGGDALVDIWDNSNFIFQQLDITNFNEVKKIFRNYKVDGIVHLAAIVGDPACKLEPDLARKINLDASMHLMDCAVRFNIPRFIFASTCSNYGKMMDSDGFVDETSSLNPISLYAELKVMFENYLLSKGKNVSGFYPTVLRFSTVYGISPRMRFDLTINEFTKELAIGRELVVYGENYWRPYCHVRDFSQAILAVLNSKQDQVAYNVFNVGDSSQSYTKKMIVNELLKLLPKSQVRYVQVGEDPRDYRVNFEKIKHTLGFTSSRTVPEGMFDILTCIQQRVFANPDEQRYYNIPVSR